MTRLLTIGEFAERCGLSRSALRFYDQNELLRPTLVDDDTGYRYYATEQLGEAALVRRLRAAEMPVGLVRRYLAADADERRAVLDAHLASFRERAEGIEREVGMLHRELAAAGDDFPDRFCVLAPSAFRQALEQVTFAVGDPAVRSELGAVWVESREDSVRLVATDSYRMAVRDLVPEAIGAIGVRGVIDATLAPQLATALEGARSLRLVQDAGGELVAAVDGRRLRVGHRGEGFPDYERILVGLPVGHHASVAREAITHALGQLPVDASHLCLDFGGERLGLRAADRRVSIAAVGSGPAIRMFLDARYFAEAVAATVGPDLVIEVSDPLQPIILRSADTGTFSVVTMPIRPPDHE